LFFIAIVDINPGWDEETYSKLEELKEDSLVTPLLIGRTLETADILLLLWSERLEAMDDYLIMNVRSLASTEELVLIPIYEFTLLPSFESVVELESEDEKSTPEEEMDEFYDESSEMMLILVRFDITPGMDREVHNKITLLEHQENDIIPLMAGHTFHSKEFDSLLFYLSNNLESVWEFSKTLRSIEGIRDTDSSIIAHFEALAPLKDFKEYASKARLGTTEGGR
jgi:hypothetical protein